MSREELDWPDKEVNLRAGIKLIRDLRKSEILILKHLENIHLEDEEYEVHELATCLNLISGLLKRHNQSITEISQLHDAIALECSDETCEKDVDSYKTEIKICFEEIASIRTTLKEKIDQEIQVYADLKRKTMTSYIDAKDLINDEDDEKPTLMKWLIDEESRTVCQKVSDEGRRSQIILSLWRVMEEEISVKLSKKKKNNLLRNKPSRFHLLKQALQIMIESKTDMKKNGVILSLELDRLDQMSREVIVLSDCT